MTCGQQGEDPIQVESVTEDYRRNTIPLRGNYRLPGPGQRTQGDIGERRIDDGPAGIPFPDEDSGKGCFVGRTFGNVDQANRTPCQFESDKIGPGPSPHGANQHCLSAHQGVGNSGVKGRSSGSGGEYSRVRLGVFRRNLVEPIERVESASTGKQDSGPIHRFHRE